MFTIPNKMEIANLPTPIMKLTNYSNEFEDVNIYVKRDDFTGIEFSGNKIRKLEYAIKEALDMGTTRLITCGGIQSNHCRATVALAKRFDLQCCLVLRDAKEPVLEGNYFLSKLLGAEIVLITPEQYSGNRMETMESLSREYAEKGDKCYIIPEGASNGIGCFGYYNCLEEIVSQEKELGLSFDAIGVTVGSGGTYGGLVLSNLLNNYKKRIIGINICDSAEFFKGWVMEILDETKPYLKSDFQLSKDSLEIIDGYVGDGYALSRPYELEFIYKLAKMEGLILDPVYTGKCMYGLDTELRKGTLKGIKNLLFIHTGGLYGLFPKKDMFTLPKDRRWGE